jgi:ABC-type glutathione transport system ATPase component
MLKVENLSVEYSGVKAVEALSFEVGEGEILGIVGESGSGKSTIAQAILRLIASPGKITAGEILLAGRDLLKLSAAEITKIRGAKISMIFQDPFTSLNPVFTIGEQIREVPGRQLPVMRLLEMVKLPATYYQRYPHQLSGGEKQRTMIAMALAGRPELLIADEPTTALDVTIQAEIIKLIKEIQKQLKISVIYITHNFGIIKALCDRVVVVYKGKKVEAGKVEQLISDPQNDYTQRLLKAVKIIRQESERR